MCPSHGFHHSSARLTCYCGAGTLLKRVIVRARYQFRCPESISILDFLITFSEYSFNTKAIDISKISLQMLN